MHFFSLVVDFYEYHFNVLGNGGRSRNEQFRQGLQALLTREPQQRTADHTFFTGGIVHVPSRIEGAVSSGQHMRSMRINLPPGAGSQFDSLSAPGESFWIKRSTEPSWLDLRLCRMGLME